MAKRIFDDINNELMDSMPALYDSRITFYVNNFQTIFNLEQTFHGETAKVKLEGKGAVSAIVQSVCDR